LKAPDGEQRALFGEKDARAFPGGEAADGASGSRDRSSDLIP